ncbi:hypothetical protein ABBQ32_008018 [Trebouxia sp. C0010 RCD-2024]
MAKSQRSKSKKAFRNIKKDQVKQSPLFLENTARKEASQAQASASGQQAHEQRAALREDSMAVEEQPSVASAAGASGIAAMDVDVGSKSKHDSKLQVKGKKAQKKGKKPRNPLNISFQKSNTKLSKAKSFKKKNKRKH